MNFMIQIRMISIKLMTYLLKLMISRRPMKLLRIKSRFVLMTKLKQNLTSLKIRTRNHWRIKSRVKDIQHQMH